MRTATITAAAAILMFGTAAMADMTLKPAIGIIGKGGMVLVKAPAEKSEAPAYSLTGKTTATAQKTYGTAGVRSNSVHH